MMKLAEFAGLICGVKLGFQFSRLDAVSVILTSALFTHTHTLNSLVFSSLAGKAGSFVEICFYAELPQLQKG